MTLLVSAFYKFVKLPHYQSLREPLREICASRGIHGTILLASEGINGTIAGEKDAMSGALAAVRNYAEFKDLESKESPAEKMPFGRLKIKLKKEIVTLGVAGVDPAKTVGSYVAPEDWNALISDPDVLVIDTRNSFEFDAGTFRSAIDPGTRSFGEFPSFVQRCLAGAKQRKIAMFCTGGIRCEKATSYLLNAGFEHVYHLKGGILKYLEVVPVEQSLWQGKCFVFDERVALGHGLTADDEQPSATADQEMPPQS
jgi:UPF0176 protein